MPPMSSSAHCTHKIWTRDSSILLGGFFVTVILIIYIWWPLAEEYFAYVDWNGEWWRYIDWLLIGIFAFMSITIIARANLKTDLLIVFVGICGGLAIESWGTQTNLWHLLHRRNARRYGSSLPGRLHRFRLIASHEH